MKSTEGQNLVVFGGILQSAFLTAFLVFVLGWPPLLTGASYVAVTAMFLIVYRRVIRPRSTLTADP